MGDSELEAGRARPQAVLVWPVPLERLSKCGKETEGPNTTSQASAERDVVLQGDRRKLAMRQ